MFNGNFIIVLVALAALIYVWVKGTTEQRGAMLVAGWCAFLLSSHLVIGFVRAVTHGERDCAKEAKALIEECEAKLPRDQNCIVEMKAVAR